ncbi:MAG: hypothetical protein HYY68_00335 [Thaumarchaeota archaeon]|nr:hypothetical protein [Nitrososphaerota archaeon]
MNRIVAFLILAAVSLVSLLLVLGWSLTNYQVGNASMNDMMKQMMGGGYGLGMQGMPLLMWSSILLLGGIVIAGVFGFVYYLAYPQIRLSSPSQQIMQPTSATTEDSKTSWSMLLRTSKPDEKKVLEVLASHNGVYLQKFIVKESGLSKLRTHRIISRFVERGVLTAVRRGNTNEIKFADWLKVMSSEGS